MRYPIEIHLVHQKEDGATLVLAIMALEGKDNLPFTFLESFLPVQIGETKNLGMAFDIASILPGNKTYFFYEGSFTTPPCSEGVHWIILQTPITISLEQVLVLQKLMPLNNYRNQQPLNGRVVKTNL